MNGRGVYILKAGNKRGKKRKEKKAIGFFFFDIDV